MVQNKVIVNFFLLFDFINSTRKKSRDKIGKCG